MAIYGSFALLYYQKENSKNWTDTHYVSYDCAFYQNLARCTILNLVEPNSLLTLVSAKLGGYLASH